MKKLVLAAIGMIGLVAGCCYHQHDHVVGLCDCDPRTWGCRTGPVGIDAQIVAPKEAKDAKEAPKKMP